MKVLPIAGLCLTAGCAGAPEAPSTSVAEPVVTAAPTHWEPVPAPAPLRTVPPRRLEARHERQLPNGLRVVVIARPGAPVVSIRLAFPSGALDDPSGDLGATQIAVGLLGEVYERDRSGKRLPAEDSLRRKIFEKGASYGWSVSHDLSHVGIDGYVEDLSDYLEQLARAVRLPRRSEQMFAAYRSSYIHELEELEPKDGPTWSALVERAAFGTRHPYARAPLGRISDLRELSLEAVIDRQDSLLTPREATLLVVGAVDVAKTHRAAQRWFGAWRAGAPPRRRRAPTPARPPRQPEALFVSVPHAKLAKICAARRLGDLRRLEDGQVELLAEVLAGGFGSRLFARLRDTHGVSYAPTGRLLRRRYARAMLICTQVPADRATEGLRYMRETLVDLRERPPEPLELERARAQLSARAAGRAASIPALVGHALEEIALGRPPRLPSGELVPIALQAQLLEARRWRFVLAGPIAPLKRAARANGLKPRRFALR